ncbi:MULTISPECIES: hypothetical protein [unclassified Mesorhizobium]|uniref:hypothetical protein n=1 Tax=unclassified Mesorhizobium TaxID=325217 RepID=UPI001FEE754D|nr:MULTISPECIES: hypothetical protein [unclassified Mesorhizobium]
MNSAENDSGIVLRPARTGDGQSLFDVTVQSVQGLAQNHYNSEQLTGWLGDRTVDYYEDRVARSSPRRMMRCWALLTQILAR